MKRNREKPLGAKDRREREREGEKVENCREKEREGERERNERLEVHTFPR